MQNPRGSYTTARTVGGNAVFELSFHIQRLVSSTRLMMEADVKEGRPGSAETLKRHWESITEEALRPRILESIRAAISKYRQLSLNKQQQVVDELKLTVLIAWDQLEDNSVQIYTHATSMGAVPIPPIKIQILGAPRQNAAAKDSDWVRSRQTLEHKKRVCDNEIVLMEDATGAVMEGLSSNFFAVVDGRLYTANEGVLLGSVREAVLRVAEKQGVVVVLQPPLLKDLNEWEAAFLSSTSRLLLPIDEISIPSSSSTGSSGAEETSSFTTKTFERTALVERLVMGVNDEVARENV